MFGGPTPPAGCVGAGGQALDRVAFADLFAVYGTTYGAGDGSTTFNVPDFRGRVAAGPYNMGGAPQPRLPFGDIGDSGGESSVKLEILHMPAHDHNSPALCAQFSNEGGTVSIQGTGYAPDDAITPGTGQTGDGSPHNNVQPTIIIPFLIYTGVQ